MEKRVYALECYEQVTEGLQPGCRRFAGGSGSCRQRSSKLLLLCALALAPAVTRAETSLNLGFQELNSANESNRTAFLTWTAEADRVYKVQSSTNLADPAAWTTEDAVRQSTVGPLKWMAPESISSSKFYRLILPQPEIFSVEPAVVAPGVAVDLYVIGQGFDSSTVLTINGVVQGDAVVQSSTSIVNLSFTPDVAGTYRVALVVGGVVVSAFNVTCADALANPELVLQGPTTTRPPASPLIGIWLSKRGYDYYKARSDLNAASLHSNPYFQENTMAGNMPTAFLSKKGYDYYQSKSAVTCDVAEGKKGLNAVNVKLARMAGGLDHRGNTVMNQSEDGVDFVRPFSGEVQACDVDMVILGRGLDFVWARTYRSRTGSATSMGQRWTHSYDVHCAQNSSGGIDVYDGTGRKDTFTLQASGTYACPQLFREVTYIATVVRVTFADTGYWEFNVFDGTATAGKLARIVDRNGNTLSLSYDTNGRLAQVVDDLGRTNTVAYTSDGHVASVTDFTGRSVTYQYYQGAKADNGGPGDLKSVTSPPVADFPNGKTNTYTYSKSFQVDQENHLLLTVTDPKGQTAAVFTYEHSATDRTNYLHCIAAQEGTNPPSCYRWTLLSSPAGSHATLKCIGNDPVGNVTETFFDARNRCVIERDYTGRATPGDPVTDTVNRPTGKLRSSDPEYYEARWSWNNDSLCTSETSPGGQQAQCVYQSDFDPATPARKRADCRVVRELATGGVDLDGDGVADVTARTWHYAYDPRFGSDPTAKPGKKLYVGNLPFSSSDSALEGSGGDGSTSQWPSLGIVPTVNKHAINTKGTGTAGRSAGMGKGMYDWIEASYGSLVPDGNGMAIKTKGTGADKNRIARTGQHHHNSGLVPDGNGVAIKTKGTGAEANRVTFGRDKLKGTTKTQGDFNLANRFSFELDGVISATDPRGNVTKASYDAKGNPAQVTITVSSCGANAPTVNFAYDNHGQLTAITNLPDANCSRRVDTFSYYASGPQAGYLQSIAIDESGVHLTTAFEYDARGNLTRYIDPRTNDWLFAYNSLDQLVQSSSATLSLCFCKIEWTYAYDANDNLVQSATELRDASGTPQGSRTDNYRYDGLNRLSEIALAVDATHAQTNRFVYDGNNQCVQVLGPDAVSGADPHQTVAYEHDERGLLFHAITAPGSSLTATHEFGYNPNGKIKRFNSELYVETMIFDGFDRLSSVTDAMGNVTTFNFDANDNLKVVRLFGELNDVPGSAGNVRLAEWRCEYDGLDRLVRTHDLFFNPATQSPIGSGDAVSTCIYAPNGECVSVTDSLSRTTSFAYDTACRLSSVTDARGNFVVSVRDQLGNVTSVTSTELPDLGGSPQVFSTTYAYDSLNRCVSTTDNVGNTSSCAYDSLDRVVRTTNPNGNDSTYAYDLMDNCVASTDYDGSSAVLPATVLRTSHATYDTSSRCLTSTDANGNTTSYAYDSLGNCTTVTQPDGTHQQMIWSPRSNLIGEQDANGTTITNVYDLCDRIVHRDLAARGPAVATTTFETFAYDGCSRLVLASNDVSRLDFHYDSFGDCTSSSQDGLAQSAIYDSEGNQLSLTYPSGRVVTYAYDALDQVTNISTISGGVSHPQLARYAYAGPGRLARIGRDNGINTRIDWNGLVNPANNPGDYGWQKASEVSHQNTLGTVVVDRRTAKFDPNQNRTQRTQTVPFYTGGGLTANVFEYDPLDQLKGSSVHLSGTPALDTLYLLDANGSRQQVTTNGVTMMPDYTMANTLPPGDFLMNRYTTTPFGAQQYDANGNLIARVSSDSVTYYQYDYANRLVEADTLSATGTNVLALTYDALGRRIASVSEAKSMAPRETRRIFGGGNRNSIIEERVDGALSQVYVHATGLQEEIRENDKVVFTATGEAHYYHCDDLGNTLALTDSGGNVLERYDYDDYGQPQFLGADGSPLAGSDGMPATASTVGNPFLFHGMEWDGESTLYCDRGMAGANPLYEDPRTGRYITVPWIPSNPSLPHSNSRTFLGNNPWSGGGTGGSQMKNGTVKFFNEAKGF